MVQRIFLHTITLVDTSLEKDSKSVGLKKEDAKNQARWRVGVNVG